MPAGLPDLTSRDVMLSTQAAHQRAKANGRLGPGRASGSPAAGSSYPREGWALRGKCLRAILEPCICKDSAIRICEGEFMPTRVHHPSARAISPDLTAQWAKIATTIVADLFEGRTLVDPALRPIRPLGGRMARVAGAAVTAWCEPG